MADQSTMMNNREHAGLKEPRYPHDAFENVLLARFPSREDIQDFTRLHFYAGFEPKVESYEGITNDELDDILLFLQAERASYKTKR